MMRLRTWVNSFFALAFAAAVGAASPSLAADKNTDLARDLIDKFYDALAPGRTALGDFLSDSFQIIGTDGLHFDRSEYLKFPKTITDYKVDNIVARRDRDILTVTFTIVYHGRFKAHERTVPSLPRLAVFRETGGNWQLVAFAALGTGINDVTAEGGKALAKFFEAMASGDPNLIRAVVSPDFQIQRSKGEGFTLRDYRNKNLPVAQEVPVVQDLVATSFSNTMITRYMLKIDKTIEKHPVEVLEPCMTVFQRINGEWRAAAHANFAAIK
jgi:hypothetical protein